MTPDEILSYPARVLTQEQREAYFDKGFVNVDEIVPADIVKSLQDTTQDFVEQSKSVSQSDDRFDIGPDHCCLLYTSPSPRDVEESRMPSSA